MVGVGHSESANRVADYVPPEFVHEPEGSAELGITDKGWRTIECKSWMLTVYAHRCCLCPPKLSDLYFANKSIHINLSPRLLRRCGFINHQ